MSIFVRLKNLKIRCCCPFRNWVWLEAKFAAHLFPLYKVLSSGQKVSEPVACKTLRQMPGFVHVGMSKLKP